MEIKGPKYIHILAPCPPGWGYNPKDSIEIGRLAVQTGFWPLYEVIEGKFVLSKDSQKFIDPAKRKPITDYLKAQKRFKSISDKEIKQYQNYIEAQWNEIEKRIKNE